MTTKIPARLAILLAIAACLSGHAAADDSGFADAITAGKATLGLRYRYEFVDQASFDRNANASTLRLRLNYDTAAWQNWTGFIEFDHVMEVIADDFNSGAGTSRPSRDEYPVVADPKGSDLNQLYFQYAPGDDWHARIGRQRILLDDQRFVGGVGWRQNEQTYDSLSLDIKSFGAAKFFYSYVANVNRIFGDSVPAGDSRHNTHLLNANVKLSDAWSIVAYAYLIDDEDVAAFSTSTYGARVSGSIGYGDGKFALIGEYAIQSDFADAPVAYDADYFRVEATWKGKALSAGAGFESLGSDDGQAFRTPLATLHAFNGWADQFLSTPAGGLEDLYVKLAWTGAAWNVQLAWHDFAAESGGGDYGSEIDASAGRKLGERYGLLLKLADFDADAAPYADTTKAWLMLTAAF